MRKLFYIAVEGPIGVGKTSLANLISLILKGKESTILDMTGLAQKGGAVWSHIKIYEKNFVY